MTNGIGQTEKSLHADGNAVYNTIQQFAGAIGVTVMSTIVASAQSNKLIRSFSYKTALGTENVFILISVLGILSFIFMIISFKMQSNKQKVK